MIRKAKAQDLEAVVNLLQDDDLGKTRESVSSDDQRHYQKVFDEINESANFDIFVMEKDQEVIGCYQLFYLPHLSFTGTQRAQIESVRIRSDLRGQGYGRKLMEHALEIAKDKGCGMVQLTSNKMRKSALRFYEDFGFECSHEGYKLYFS